MNNQSLLERVYTTPQDVVETMRPWVRDRVRTELMKQGHIADDALMASTIDQLTEYALKEVNLWWCGFTIDEIRECVDRHTTNHEEEQAKWAEWYGQWYTTVRDRVSQTLRYLGYHEAANNKMLVDDMTKGALKSVRTTDITMEQLLQHVDMDVEVHAPFCLMMYERGRV